jgi:hypothetical protein
MRKQLPTASITNELAGSSVFFTAPPVAESAPAAAAVETPVFTGTERQEAITPPITAPAENDTVPPRNHASTPSANGATVTAANDAAPDPALLEAVRRTTKQIGKEAATHRFTAVEKQMIAEIVYICARQGTRTSENEITRIAVNWILLDYQKHGPRSVLTQLLASLHG